MEGELDAPDPAQLRISDADRHQVAEILREAAGEGRIDLDELDERLEATYAAKTYADLVPITARPAGPRATSAPRTAGRPRASVARSGPRRARRRDPGRRSSRKGVWLVAAPARRRSR